MLWPIMAWFMSIEEWVLFVYTLKLLLCLLEKQIRRLLLRFLPLILLPHLRRLKMVPHPLIHTLLLFPTLHTFRHLLMHFFSSHLHTTLNSLLHIIKLLIIQHRYKRLLLFISDFLQKALIVLTDGLFEKHFSLVVDVFALAVEGNEDAALLFGVEGGVLVVEVGVVGAVFGVVGIFFGVFSLLGLDYVLVAAAVLVLL